MMRRRGPGLVRMAATTAVVAGTAGAVSHHQQQKYANQAADQQASQQQIYDQGVAAGQAAAAPAPRRRGAGAVRDGRSDRAAPEPREPAYAGDPERRGVRSGQGEGARDLTYRIRLGSDHRYPR